MLKRGYKITFDLKEGYSKDGKEHTLASAEHIIREWMQMRLQHGQPIVTGLLQGGTLFFPSAGKNADNSVTVSHSAIFTGELSTAEDQDRDDEEVKKTLEALANAIKTQLKQQSVYIIYRDANWCI